MTTVPCSQIRCSLFPFYINPMFTSQIKTLYEVKVVIEEEEFTVEVLRGNELVNSLLGVLWLRTKRLVVDFPMGVLTLG
ncbi:hypothetical protein BI334_10900 [Moorena producens 3L]|nr:hypothetical protein BI334_10900 [Moorena producens 3L]